MGSHSSPGISEMILVAKYLGLIGMFVFFLQGKASVIGTGGTWKLNVVVCLVCVID